MLMSMPVQYRLTVDRFVFSWVLLAQIVPIESE